MKPIDLSIIIVNWNTREMLIECLDSIFRQQLASDLEVWVVDNASTDGSVQAIRERFSQVNIIENPVNSGFAAANNQALERASGKYLLLLNPDTLLGVDCLERLVSIMDNDPGIGAAGPRLLSGDGSFQPSCFPIPTLGREFWRLFHLDSIRPLAVYPSFRWDEAPIQDVDSLQGACLLVRREVLQAVGLLDTDYFMYSEEIDLCYRIQKAGWRLVWVGDVDVIHYGGQSSQQVKTRSFLHLYQGKVIFFRKHYGRGQAFSYLIVLALSALFRLVFTPFAWLEPDPERGAHLQLAKNYLRLILSIPQF